ncbi:MAG TPA: hypothetical protein VEZ55_16365 [Chitinophagaceae bacterium]|jgi:hypothetical protein|nr:hypothetical protein [Chitinophagaceae bacterium]
MQPVNPLTEQLEVIASSFIKTSPYDPTTCYLNDSVFDRDEFKKLKKAGYLEISFEDRHEKRFTLSSKAKELLKVA